MSKVKCLRCGFQWNPHLYFGRVPKRCCSCRSPLWNVPYRRNISKSVLNPLSSFASAKSPALAARLQGRRLGLPVVKATHDLQLDIPQSAYAFVRGHPAPSKISVRVKASRAVVVKASKKSKNTKTKCK